MNLNNGIGAILIPVIIYMAGCSTQQMIQQNSALPVTQQDNVPPEKAHDSFEPAQHDYDRALEYLDSGRNNNAKQLLLALTEAYPEFSGPYANLGILYMREGSMETAEEYLTKAVEINPANAMAYNQLGILYRQTGRFDAARQAYIQSLQIKPDYANAHLNLGILCDLFLQDTKGALQHYERYLELVPGENSQVSLWLADLKQRIANNNISTNEIQ